MNSVINTYALNHNPVSSNAIGVLGFVAHNFNTEGEYVGVVLRSNAEVGTFRVTVSKNATATQADLDLSTFVKTAPVGPECCADAANSQSAGTAPSYTIASGGYLVCHTSTGSGDFQVRLGRQAEAGGSISSEFDSALLSKNDLFAVTLLRPGHYRLEDQITGAMTHVRVAYPPDPNGPFVQPEPIQVDVSNGFNQQELNIQPSQPLVFTQQTDNHVIVLTLESPDDGPGNGPIHWTGAS